MATLDELTTPATRQEIEAAIYRALAARGAKATTWKPGAVVRSIITGVSIVLAGFSRLQAQIARGGFLELAEGDWLTLVARYVYDVERSTGTFATATVTVNNTGGGVFSGDPGDLVFINTSEGKTYRNTEAFSIGALEEDVEIPVEAVELGTASNAAADEIDDFETPLLGVTIVSSTPAVAQDEETDAALRARCRAKTGTLSPNGPRDAYVYVALSAVDADGVSVGVTRVKTVPDGVGGIDVYVANAAGTVSGDAEDPSTALGAVAAAIHQLAEPVGITATVQSAAAKSISITYTLWVYDTSGYTNGEIEERVLDRLTTWLAGLPIGGVVKTGDTVGRVYVDALEAVIAGTLPDALIDVAVASPAADVDLDPNEAPVLGTPTATIVQVTGGTS